MSEQYTPTTSEVLWAWAEWRRPFLERDNWFPTAASLREASNAEFQRWLAERDAEVAAKAWALCDATITEHLVGNTAITAAIASGWPENPYREAVQS